MVDAFKITLPFLNSKSHYPSQIQNHTTLPKPACVPLSHPIGSGTYSVNLHTPSHTCSLTQRPHMSTLLHPHLQPQDGGSAFIQRRLRLA